MERLSKKNRALRLAAGGILTATSYALLPEYPILATANGLFAIGFLGDGISGQRDYVGRNLRLKLWGSEDPFKGW